MLVWARLQAWRAAGGAAGQAGRACRQPDVASKPGGRAQAVRRAGATKHATGDQTRVTTPAEAMEAGADFIVVGRPITAAPDPREATRKVLAEL